MNAAEHLSSYGVTTAIARDFIMSNLSNPQLIFKTCVEYNFNAAMIAEVLQPDFSGITEAVVHQVFWANGLNSNLLRSTAGVDSRAGEISTIVYKDYNQDSVDEIQSHQDQSGNPILEYKDWDGDGLFEALYQEFVYASDGSYMRFKDERNEGYFEYWYQHDDQGNKTVQYQDNEGDGIYDARAVLTEDHTSKIATFRDFDGDGIYEAMDDIFVYQGNSIYEFRDPDTDGVYDLYHEISVTPSGIWIHLDDYQDSDLDGGFDKLQTRDDAGQLLSVTDFDPLQLPQLQYRQSTTGAQQIDIDLNRDGIIEQMYLHDSAGGVTHMYRDSNNDGVFEQYYEVYLSGQRSLHYSDQNGDGVFENVSLLG